MIKISYGNTLDSRQRTLSKLQNLKKQGTYRVIDVGGTHGGGWSAPVADLIIDINASSPNAISIDICNSAAWKEVESIVDVLGKFDYAICTHTLEDLYDPVVTLSKLPRIAKRGIITMPSIITELSNVESSLWLGYIHHRWLFHEEDGKMLLIPKLSVLESMCKNRFKFKPATSEIAYEWENEINYSMFMNNYLGPNVGTVIREFTKIIDKASKL